MTRNIAIIAAHDNRTIAQVTWELLACARQLQDLLPAEICFYLIGDDTRKLAADISTRTGCHVTAADVPGTGTYHPERHKSALEQLLKDHDHACILAPHTTSGMDYAPALAIALGCVCITAVNSIKADTSGIFFSRSVYGGKLQAVFTLPERQAVITLQPGSFAPVTDHLKAPENITHTRIEPLTDKMIYNGRQPSLSAGSDLAKAQIIVSGGRGLKTPENYALVEQLAALFPRSATGASRPICDYGWTRYSQQVGITGAIVSPDLYIACGISGSTQHIEGMKDSRFIVAINDDADAPIFRIADICIVDDLCDFIPVFIEVFQKKKAPGR